MWVNSFTLHCKPVGQMRARSRVIGRHAATYKDPAQEAQEQTLASLLAPHAPREPVDGPVTLFVDAYLPLPKSKPKKWQAAARAGEIIPTVKPDADNLAKHLKDVMGQLHFWLDDKQVADLRVRKFYADVPRWEVTMAWGEARVVDWDWGAGADVSVIGLVLGACHDGKDRRVSCHSEDMRRAIGSSIMRVLPQVPWAFGARVKSDVVEFVSTLHGAPQPLSIHLFVAEDERVVGRATRQLMFDIT